ncbi:hypothetical protein FQN51_003429 [Onygenales sp. PD_10]|nr:hypothetical protein FQN51_003429 [Onygenales sp. PD_10]
MTSQPQLPQLASVAEKTLTSKCKPGSLTYCPTMDLVALASVDEKVDVFRLNGQRVFGGVYGEGDGGRSGGGGEVRRIRWKGSGNLLAIVCEDNIIRIISAYSGKTVHRLPCGPSLALSSTIPPTSSPASPVGPTACVTCLGWGINFTDGKSALKSLKEAEGRLTVDDLLSTEVQLSNVAQLKLDLPRELAMLDMERSLPKLSTLPSTGNDDDVFSSRVSIDSIFHAPYKSGSDSVDVLLAGFDDGTIHLRIFDCFDIGSFQVASSLGDSTSSKLLLYSSHPISSTHSLLFSTDDELRLVTLDLRFITRSGRYLSLLASKITQLQNLLRYIKQVQNQIQLEWKNAQDLPGRYMRNITEDLQDKCACDFVTAAYHLLVTGDCFAPLKEFLVDIVGDRGHKRWEKAVSSGYDALRRLTHECLLPALERCGVLLSRLIGLSKFHTLSPILGLETTDLRNCQDTVDCLSLLSHKVLIHSGQEIREFNAFSKWLKHEIDLQAADPLSATYEELVEKSDTLDHVQTLSYISGAMTHSVLNDFIQPVPPGASPNRWEPAGQYSSFYETYKKLLQQQDQKKPAEKIDMPLLGDLTSRFASQSEKVFGRIAETQRRGILHRSPLTLGPDCDGAVVDMTMNFGPFEDCTFPSVYVAARSKSSPCIFYLYRVILDMVNGVSSTKAIFLATVNLQSGKITQIKFVEDGTLMLLWRDATSTTHLVNFAYISNPDAPFQPNYTRLGDGGGGSVVSPSSPSSLAADQITQLYLAHPGQHAEFVQHTFPQEAGMEPVELQVNGRKGRRVVCVLYADGMRYSVFDIDSAGIGDGDEEEVEGEMEGDDQLMVE